MGPVANGIERSQSIDSLTAEPERLLEYEQAAMLSETYLVQRAIGQTVRLIAERVLTPQNFEPTARRSMLQTHRMLFVELGGQESYLIDVYRGTLRQLTSRGR